MHSAKDNGKTEDVDHNITEQRNIDRIRSEIAHCSIVILCGKKADLLSIHLREKVLIKTPHLGNRGLRNKYINSSPFLNGIKTATDRDLARLRLCAECILEQLRKSISYGAGFEHKSE
jgi:hypothetical protein